MLNVSIRKRGPDSWTLQPNHRDETGARIWLRAETVRGTRRDAERRAEEIKLAAEQGRPVRGSDTALGDYLTGWIRRRAKRNQIAATTAQNYADAFAPLIEALGTRPLRTIDGKAIEAFYDARLEVVSAGTLKALHVPLKKALADAVAAGDLIRNPMDGVAAPRAASERRALDLEHVRALLDRIADRPLARRLILLAISTGLRRGELAALRWRDLDLDAGTLTVARARVRLGKSETVRGPKTAAGRRTIALPASLVAEFRAIEDRAPDAPVLVTEDGRAPTLSYLSNVVRDALDACGLGSEYCLHALRHTHATHLLRDTQNVKAVSARLGHANATVTMSVYAHVLRGDDARLAGAADALIAA